MAGRLISNLAKKLFLKTLERSSGDLEVVCPQQTYSFGSLADPAHENSASNSATLADASPAMLAVHNERFFRRAVFGGDIGVGESYMDGDWSTPDLVSVVRFGVRNLDRLDSDNRLLSLASRFSDLFSHRRNRNTKAGSRKNIAHHYDLGNDFYRLFLDQSLAYSCAYYGGPQNSPESHSPESSSLKTDVLKADSLKTRPFEANSVEPASLEAAQRRKFDLICRKLQLQPGDHLLEIGTGWGGFAAHAADRYGCRVTTTTISRQQYEYACELFARRDPDAAKIDLLFEDYRNLPSSGASPATAGKYDKIVSIEMFEAVGHEHYDDYFKACDALLKPDGSMLLQTITIQEAKFHQYLRQSDWIKKYIFPGAELASVTEILRSLARATRLQAFHLEDIGMHYALTLAEWRRRFLENLAEVRRLGFDERFIRMWDYYLAYCEAAFRERYISDVQLLLSKVTNRTPLMNEPAMRGTLQEVER